MNAKKAKLLRKLAFTNEPDGMLIIIKKMGFTRKQMFRAIRMADRKRTKNVKT